MPLQLMGDLAQDATATVKVNVTALETSNGTRPYNTAKVVAENGSVDGDGMTTMVTTLIPLMSRWTRW